jgi:hypothetical protein
MNTNQDAFDVEVYLAIAAASRGPCGDEYDKMPNVPKGERERERERETW